MIIAYTKKIAYTSRGDDRIEYKQENDSYMVLSHKAIEEILNAKTCHNCKKKLTENVYISSYDYVFCSSNCLKEYDKGA
jgi:hypothetical protein